MNLWKALLMAVVLVVTGLYVWKYEQEHAGPDKETAKSELVFPGISAKEVSGFSVIHNGVTYPLERVPEKEHMWQTRKPRGARVNQEAINKLLRSFLQVQVRNSISAEEADPDPAVYGLRPPELFVTLKGSFGRRVVSFGKEHPLSKRRYVQPEHDNRIFLVDGSLFTSIVGQVEQIRNRQPLHFTVPEVESVAVVRATGESIRLARRSTTHAEAGRWLLKVGDKEYAADTTLVERELNELAQLKISRLVDDVTAIDLPIYGISDPTLLVQVRLKKPNIFEERDITARIGEGVATVVVDDGQQQRPAARVSHFLKVAEDPTIYQFERRFYSDWLQGPEHFFLKQPFYALDTANVSEVIIKRDKHTPKKWNAPAQAKPVALLTQGLRSITVLSYQPLPAADFQRYGLTSPQMAIAVTTAGKQAVFAVGKPVAAGDMKKDDATMQNDRETSATPHFCLIKLPERSSLLAVVSGHVLSELEQAIAHVS